MKREDRVHEIQDYKNHISRVQVNHKNKTIDDGEHDRDNKSRPYQEQNETEQATGSPDSSILVKTDC